MSVTLKFKTLWQLVIAAGSLFAMYRILEVVISHGSPSLWELMVFVSALVTTITVLFIAPTTRVVLDDDGFLIHVGVGILWYEWLLLKNKRLTWDQVVNVVMVTPKWYPIKFIAVVGSDGIRTQTFALGTCISNTPAGLEFLSRHVDKRKIDDDVLTLIEKTLANL